MLRRTIVMIEQDAAGVLTAKLAKAEEEIPDAWKPLPLACDIASLPPLDSPVNVRAYGRCLRDALMGHPAIGIALRGIFRTPAGEPRTLCFEIMAPDGEQVRWEVMCDHEERFVALEGRCRLGRIADQVSNHDSGIRTFSAPLRLTAFLSAAGVDAAPEWSALRDAVGKARATGLAIEVRVYVGQQELLDEIASEIAAGSHPEFTVRPIPPSAVELEQELSDPQWQPHIVHFFCHGSAGYGMAYLELATVREHDVGTATGSVVLQVDTLVTIPGLRGAWLVVLNCCEGGQAAERLYSMAYRIVASGGVPAAIGMQEPVAAGDANAICATLYPELFGVLREAVSHAAGGAPATVDLTAAIGPPRRALDDRHRTSPTSSARWTLPVLYVHREPLRVHHVGSTMAAPGAPATPLSLAELEEMRQRIELVANFLRGLPPSTPLPLRDMALATLDTPPRVPDALRPDRLGRFLTDG